VRGAFFVLICLGILLSIAGISIHYFEVPDSLSFPLWLGAGVGMVVLMHNARILRRVVPSSLLPLPAVEGDVN
jgi:hypothetical protein